MKAVLSLLFLSILIFCVWSGYKKGLVMGIFSLIAFVVSVYGANLLSQTYSGEVIDALRPFASGFVEVNVVDKTVRPAMGIDSTNLSVKDYFAAESRAVKRNSARSPTTAWAFTNPPASRWRTKPSPTRRKITLSSSTPL